ncbi:Ecp32-2 [Fulvia fulva]|uniref:Ecp32-2 n=1 Tax=Passalora fulva TaxID=5499 RepID=A0A1P8YXN1_PASFU|nr:Ecp32-2 [Fulvia fulva]AQA29272.1 extracellular protein 32-2 [Fulvia fulva]KAK4625456.1 Ecp32-2 [Fulvia fulva]UJO18379.1 Ecp32-2 [Fulvia fulva]
MKSFIAATFVAAAAAQAGTTEPLRFTGLAQGPSGTLLNAGVINANGGSFWIGKDTVTSVPANTDSHSVIGQSNTKNGNTTIFTYLNSQSTFNLDVVVPRGQAVFVSLPGGKLKFTKGNHAAAGRSLTHGFANVYDATLKFEGKGWLGCGNDATGYEIFAASRAPANKAGCQRFSWKLKQVDAVVDGGPSQAYQYV